MNDILKNNLITTSEMYDMDEESIISGVSSKELMENAGAFVSDILRLNFTKKKVIILCGKGNNSGDGLVAARRLKEAGWDIRVVLLFDKNSLSDDCKYMLNFLEDKDFEDFSENIILNAEIIIDAIFGSGLNRKLDFFCSDIIKLINYSKAKVLSIDVPTGVNGNNGLVDKVAVEADLTVTFITKKIGHVLYPGKNYCGKLFIGDIGTPKSVLKNIKSTIWENSPNLWLRDFIIPNSSVHKYLRGYSIVKSGPHGSTNASKLAALSSLRVGSGVVSICCDKESIDSFSSAHSSLLIKECNSTKEFQNQIRDNRCTAVLIGPGNGLSQITKESVLISRRELKPCVIDADAISVFKDNPEELFSNLDKNCILTPHEGEFKRIFSNLSGTKIQRVENASKIAGCIIVLKGPDTVIGSPDGKLIINSCAPPSLATAGSGDVLAGIILGLLSNGMDPFLASSAAVWIHSNAAKLFGYGLIADDLIDLIPKTLNNLFSIYKNNE